MARLLYEWLNIEVGLSKEVRDIEWDFRDGYLLGELLHKYNQQPDFEKFVDKDTPDAKINNFCLLEPTVRRIGISFNSKIAFEIINGKPNVMRSLLYEFKVALDKLSKSSIGVNPDPNATGTLKSKVLRVVQPQRPTYDKTMAVTFENSIRAIMQNPNDLMMEKTLQKYKVGHTQDFRNSIALGYSQSLDAATMDLQHRKEIHRNRKKHENEFIEAWNSINIDQWKKNQLKARERRQLEKRLEFQATSKAENRIATIRQTTRSATLDSIDKFDERLETEIIPEDPDISKTVGMALQKHFVPEEGMDIPHLTYIDKSFLDAGLLAAQKTMKEHCDDSITRKQLHDRRRRRFGRELDSFQSSFLHRSNENEIVKQLVNNCRSELDEKAAKVRVFKHKGIVTENRNNRDELVRSMNNEEADRRAAWQQHQAEREKVWVVYSTLRAQNARYSILKGATESANRQQSIEVASAVLDRVLDLVDWVCACRDFGLLSDVRVPDPPPTSDSGAHHEGHHEDSRVGDGAEAQAVPLEPVPLLPADLWADASRMFTSSLGAVAGALPFPEPSNVCEQLPHALSQRPHCVSLEWLTHRAFQSYDALPGPVPPMGSPEFDPTTADDQMQSVSRYLADVDTKQHFDVIASVEIEGFQIPGAVVAGDGMEGGTASTEAEDATAAAGAALNRAIPPKWIQTTPAKNLLGEVLVDVSCVADPLLDDPEPAVRVPSMPHRYVIVGASDLAKKHVAAALQKNVPGLCILRVQELVDAAAATGLALQQQQQQQLADDSALSDSQKLAGRVCSWLRSGRAVTDEMYVSLIIQSILELPSDASGFVVEDFPDTKAQALLLLEALSGINYDSHKPQAMDRASVFAPPAPRETIYFDPSKCGLSAAIILRASDDKDVEVSTNTSERVAARTDMATGQRVMIKDDTTNVAGLQELCTPKRPTSTSSLDSALTIAQRPDVETFFDRVGILRTFVMEDCESYETVAAAVAAEIAPPPPQPEVLEEEDESGIVVSSADDLNFDNADERPRRASRGEMLGVTFAPVVDSDVAPVVDGDVAPVVDGDVAPVVDGDVAPVVDGDVAPVVDGDVAPSAPMSQIASPSPNDAIRIITDAAALGNFIDADMGKLSPVAPAAAAAASLSEASLTISTLHPVLARALRALWSEAEAQSFAAATSFFTALRDIRYQMLQRRRGVHDVLQSLLVRRDNRQNMLEEFREGFNDIDPDFRFDPDCQAELLLRTLELREALGELCDRRKKEADEWLENVATDSVVLVIEHRIQCEGAAILQSHLSRFTTSVNVLLDYAKAVTSYNVKQVAGNSLEEVAHDAHTGKASPAKGKDAKGKDAKGTKDSKGKGKDLVTTEREAVAVSLLPSEMMSVLPDHVPAAAVAADPKAKKPNSARGKHDVGAPGSGDNPFTVMHAAVLEKANTWSKDSYHADRSTFGDDEQLSAAFEAAVWHEAERLKVCVAQVHEIVKSQVHWVKVMESSLFTTMKEISHKRHISEVLAGQVLVDMAVEAVHAAEPIRTEWLAAPDAVAVVDSRLVVPPPPPAVVPSINEFPVDHLNHEQVAQVDRWVDAMRTGTVVMAEDMHSMLDRGLSQIGPLGGLHLSSSKRMDHVTFPKAWRGMGVDVPAMAADEALRQHLIPTIKVVGVNERRGVVNAAEAVELLASKGIYHQATRPLTSNL